jgi:hypothetical protein
VSATSNLHVDQFMAWSVMSLRTSSVEGLYYNIQLVISGFWRGLKGSVHLFSKKIGSVHLSIVFTKVHVVACKFAKVERLK